MTLDAQLLEILVCPNDRGDVDYREAEQVHRLLGRAGTAIRSATTSR